MVKNLPANAGDAESIPGLGRSFGEGNGNSTPVFLPGTCHGQRSLAGYSPWGHRVRHNLVVKHHHQYMCVYIHTNTHAHTQKNIHTYTQISSKMKSFTSVQFSRSVVSDSL